MRSAAQRRGDDLRGFYSFASETQGAAWTGTGWAISGDAVHASGSASWTSTRSLQGDGYLVRADVASLTVAAGNSFAITLDGDGVSTGATCHTHRHDAHRE